jgi:RNA polymerase sigma factor (sigma-70 family)
MWRARVGTRPAQAQSDDIAPFERTAARGGRLLAEVRPWADLMRRVAADRDREAFAMIFDHFAPRLESFLGKNGADAALAEEIVQDVMVTLWRKAHLFDQRKSSLATWLYRIARNRRIDLIRRDRTDYLDPLDTELNSIADETEIDTTLDLQQREDILREAIKTLPDEQLVLVRLAFFESLSHSTIAERTGLPLGTVKSRIRLAFARLRKSMEQQGVLAAR